MRLTLSALFVLSLGAALHAQTTPPAKSALPAKSAADVKLDGYLKSWEQAMRKIVTLKATLTRLDRDKAFDARTRYSGEAQYMKSGSGTTALNLAALEMRQDGKKEVAEKFISTGSYIYQFAPAQKEIRQYEVPKPKAGEAADTSFLGFLFGMKAEDARKRYLLTMEKEDKWYIYVSVVPRYASDKADFLKARIVLNRDTYLPRQLWFLNPNGNETTWDIPKIQTGVTLDRRGFDTPKAPTGWKIVPVSTAKAQQPRVVRPQK